ncbi:hypothetical protein PMAYCL1PPCAC_31336, partial [Pristionchus mayeri]
ATCVSPSMDEHHHGVLLIFECVVPGTEKVEIEAILARRPVLVSLAEQLEGNLHALFRVLETLASVCPLVGCYRL